MAKMKKLSVQYLSGQYVKAVVKELGKCVIKFLEAPHLEDNEAYKNKSYHALVSIPEIEVLAKNEEGKPTKFGKATGEMLEMVWNMNGKTSDFLSDKFDGDTDNFEGEEIEIATLKMSVSGEMKDVIYPVELTKEADD